MAIIKSDQDEYLLLRTNPDWLKVDIWFIVTGSVEKEDKSEKDAVKREVEEETGLEIMDIEKTDYVSEYEWPRDSGKHYTERAYVVKVKQTIPRLSGEHLESKWLDKETFIDKIYWEGDKKELNKILDLNI